MPVQEDVGVIKSFTWALNTIEDMRELQDTMAYLGVDSSVWRHCHAEGPGGRMEIPDTGIRTNPSILVESFGRLVRTTTMNDSTLINIELLPLNVPTNAPTEEVV